MRKQIALLTTVAALAVTPALAQTTPDQSKQQPAPQAQPSQPSTTSPSSPSAMPSDKSDKAGTPSTTTTTQTPATDSKPMAGKAGAGEKFVDMQASGQWLASDVMGMTVVGSSNDNIGEVNDLLMDDKGNIVAVIVGVGGFLGIGEKDVALSFETLQITTDKDGDPQARITLTKEELESAPEFKTQAEVKSDAQRPASPGGGSKPAPQR